MIYRVSHTSTYGYTEPVVLCHNLAHLTLRDGPRQSCLQSELQITPAPDVSSLQTDYFGNKMTFFAIQKPHLKLIVTARHEAEVLPYEPLAPEQTPPWEEARAEIETSRAQDTLQAYQFAFDSPYCKATADLAAYAQPSFTPQRPLLDAVLDLTHRIYTEFRYDRLATTIATPLAEVLANRRGICQDFAHLQIGCMRSLGLAARYVSGYLLTTPPPGMQRLVGSDASHAWVSVFCPGLGWVDFDPTNDGIPSDQHITLAWGRDYGDVSPIKGVILGGRQHSVTVSVDVLRTDWDASEWARH